MGQQCIRATNSNSNKDGEFRRGISEYSAKQKSSENTKENEMGLESNDRISIERKDQDSCQNKNGLKGKNEETKTKKYKKNNQFNKHEQLPGVLIIGNIDLPISKDGPESQSAN